MLYQLSYTDKNVDSRTRTYDHVLTMQVILFAESILKIKCSDDSVSKLIREAHMESSREADIHDVVII